MCVHGWTYRLRSITGYVCSRMDVQVKVYHGICVLTDGRTGIHPSDHHLLGFTWNNCYYYDRCIPMGASSSCQIFESFSCVLQWIMEFKYKAAGMSHIIDDFLFVVPPKSNKCLQDCNFRRDIFFLCCTLYNKLFIF
jgi:hypothetical protein